MAVVFRQVAPPTALSPAQVRRYARHVLLPDIGGVGQQRLLAARVVVPVGPTRAAEVAALAYLAAAGVGTIVLSGEPDGIVTDAEIAAGIVFRLDDAGRRRGDVLAARLGALNPDVRVICDADAAQSSARLALEEPAVARGPDERVADALARGGAAAARLVHRLATGAVLIGDAPP